LRESDRGKLNQRNQGKARNDSLHGKELITDVLQTPFRKYNSEFASHPPKERSSMPTKVNDEILAAVIESFEGQKKRINARRVSKDEGEGVHRSSFVIGKEPKRATAEADPATLHI
jgi:hypothetical protein